MYVYYIYITYIYIDLVIYTYNIRYNALYNAWMGWVGACSHRDWFFSAPSRDMGQNPGINTRYPYVCYIWFAIDHQYTPVC